jgi:hypothetical protein
MKNKKWDSAKMGMGMKNIHPPPISGLNNQISVHGKNG